MRKWPTATGHSDKKSDAPWEREKPPCGSLWSEGEACKTETLLAQFMVSRFFNPPPKKCYTAPVWNIPLVLCNTICRLGRVQATSCGEQAVWAVQNVLTQSHPQGSFATSSMLQCARKIYKIKECADFIVAEPLLMNAHHDTSCTFAVLAVCHESVAGGSQCSEGNTGGDSVPFFLNTKMKTFIWKQALG